MNNGDDDARYQNTEPSLTMEDMHAIYEGTLYTSTTFLPEILVSNFTAYTAWNALKQHFFL